MEHLEMLSPRKKTRAVGVGNIYMGGGNKITVQSMTTTDTRDVYATLEQIKRLTDAGCEVVRVAVADGEACRALKEIKKGIKIPLVADIHFNYRLALDSIDNGADKIRINPGNIGSHENVKKLVKKAKEHHVPIRIGINSGSIEKDILLKFGKATPQAMVESAFGHIKILEENDFQDMVISLKASSVPMTIAAYRLMSKKCEYPLHLGVTEAGTPYSGIIKSAAALGCLLAEGIGDTIRVSLTGDPVEEVTVGHGILRALSLEKRGPNLISCPTCGRCKIDLISIANRVEDAIRTMDKNITVAVMGCAVNGPGEARDADIGIAGGDGFALLFKKGKIAGKYTEKEIVDVLLAEIEKM